MHTGTELSPLSIGRSIDDFDTTTGAVWFDLCVIESILEPIKSAKGMIDSNCPSGVDNHLNVFKKIQWQQRKRRSYRRLHVIIKKTTECEVYAYRTPYDTDAFWKHDAAKNFLAGARRCRIPKNYTKHVTWNVPSGINVDLHDRPRFGTVVGGMVGTVGVGKGIACGNETCNEFWIAGGCWLIGGWETRKTSEYNTLIVIIALQFYGNVKTDSVVTFKYKNKKSQIAMFQLHRQYPQTAEVGFDRVKCAIVFNWVQISVNVSAQRCEEAVWTLDSMKRNCTGIVERKAFL